MRGERALLPPPLPPLLSSSSRSSTLAVGDSINDVVAALARTSAGVRGLLSSEYSRAYLGPLSIDGSSTWSSGLPRHHHQHKRSNMGHLSSASCQRPEFDRASRTMIVLVAAIPALLQRRHAHLAGTTPCHIHRQFGGVSTFCRERSREQGRRRADAADALQVRCGRLYSCRQGDGGGGMV